MNDLNNSSTFAALLSSMDQITLFLIVIGILITGAFITALITGAGKPASSKLFSSPNPVSSNERIEPLPIRRRLYLHPLQGDKYGVHAEKLLGLIRKEFKPRAGAFWQSADNARPFQILTGLRDEKTTKLGSTKTPGTTSRVEITMGGSVQGNTLNLRFFPQGPLHFIETDGTDTQEAKKSNFFFECSDFPLSELKSLNLSNDQNNPSHIEESVLNMMLAGLMSRGSGIDNQIVSFNKLEKWAKKIDDYLMSDISTHQEMNSLQTECIVIAAWGYLISGLGAKSQKHLKRSLELHQLLSEKNWQGREAIERAGAQSNEAYAAYALMLLTPANRDYPKFIKQTVLKALRTFRPENYPEAWGKLICKLACAKITSAQMQLEGQFEGDKIMPSSAGEEKQKHGSQSAVQAGEDQYQSYHSIELALDQAIELWRKNKQTKAIRASMSEAYFAKGKLALIHARLNMGVQELERAENGFLAALALANENHQGPQKLFYKVSVIDIRRELGQLYLDWGTRFGEAELIEKAIHHFSTLLELQNGLSKSQLIETKCSLAECYLNFGGITNKSQDHSQAIYSYNDVLDMGLRGEQLDRVERCIAVARARLALISHKREEVEMATSSICSVIGQNGKLWPTKDVLLRLRARLRELSFTLEGDDIALDRAINDRRELVKLAEGGVQDIRWAVEVGDLVRLLSKRQFKSNGQSNDFREAHYLLETAIAIAEKDTAPDEESAGRKLEIPNIKGSLYITMAKLLSSFARVHLDELALREAAIFYQRFIDITPRATNPQKRAEALSQIGLIMMDLSEQYGAHGGLKQAIATFAEAHDIYLEIGLIDLSNRMRRFLENAQAAELAYLPPSE